MTINPKNKDDQCFPYAVIVATNYQNIISRPEIISNIKPFIDQYDWKKFFDNILEKDFPVQQKDWKKFELNNKSISLNILFVPCNNEKIRLSYKSEYNNEHKNQFVLSIITDGKKWHYLVVKTFSALLRGIISNHNGDFYCLHCVHLCRTEKNSRKIKKYVMIMIIVT